MSSVIPEAFGSVVPADFAVLEAVGGMPVGDDGVPFLGRRGKCVANNDTCGANAIEGGVYCVGHTRSLAPHFWREYQLRKQAAKYMVAQDDTPQTVDAVNPEKVFAVNPEEVFAVDPEEVFAVDAVDEVFAEGVDAVVDGVDVVGG